MSETNQHLRVVEQWTIHVLKSLSQDEILLAFNHLFSRVWSSAELTLGKITLQAVTDRVISIASDIYPWIIPENFSHKGLDLCDELRAIQPDELKSGLGFILGEFLLVLGNLTANVISEKLHALIQQELLDDGLRTEVLQNNEDSTYASAKSGKKK